MARSDVNVMVAFGKANICKVAVAAHVKHVILALDNRGAATYQESVHQAIARQCGMAKTTLTIAISKTVGHDFNDCLAQQGIHEVKHTTEHAISPKALDVISQIYKKTEGKDIVKTNVLQDNSHLCVQKVTYHKSVLSGKHIADDSIDP